MSSKHLSEVPSPAPGLLRPCVCSAPAHFLHESAMPTFRRRRKCAKQKKHFRFGIDLDESL